jgi:transposase
MRARASREIWRRRVERWGRSGRSAREFAAAGGFHAETLRQWKYKLQREAQVPASLPLLEVVASRPRAAADPRFEVELVGGRRLRVPVSFDSDVLRRLLAILDGDDGATK